MLQHLKVFKSFIYSSKNRSLFFSILAYASTVCCVYLIMYQLGILSVLPGAHNIIQWDAKWYYSISLYGYEYIENSICNMAFFPFFPYLWRYTGLSGIGICIVNGIIFLISFYLLFYKQRQSIINIIFILSTPSLFFFYIPYSESTFFLAASLILIGYREQSTKTAAIGFFCASLVRSVSIIFVPAIIAVAFLLSWSKNSKKTHIIDAGLFLLASLAGFMISSFVQYYQTGRLFYFLEIQQYWRRTWLLPEFPLSTYNADQVIALDAMSLVIGIYSILQVLNVVFQYLNKQAASTLRLKPEIFFSMLIIAATTILDTFFTFNLDDSTNIWSMNRHTFCTPFYMVVIAEILTQKFSRKNFLVFAMLVLIGLFLTTVHNYPLMILLYLNFFISIYLIKSDSKFKYIMIFLIILNVAYQLMLFGSYLSGSWIG